MSENAAEAGLPAREFGWWDVFVPPDADPREEGDVPVGERATLVRYHADFLRERIDGRVGQ
jgi:hypothetical protein